MLDSSKKEKILEASIQEFSEHGFDKANTDRICRRAEVSKGLIFHYFGSKENLFMAAMDKCVDDVVEEFNDLAFPDGDFVQILLKMIEVKYNFFSNHPMHYKLLMKGFYNSPAKLRDRLAQRYAQVKQIGIDTMVDIIKGLPVKKNVETKDIVSVISGITAVVESKYIPAFADGSKSFEEYYLEVKDEYMNLMNIVMYGMLEDGKN